MKVLVTGGAGFIGSHIVDALIGRGHEVRVFDNLEPQVHGENPAKPDYLSGEAEFVEGDVRSRQEFASALDGVEVVYHEAAAVGVGQSQYQIEKYVDVNTLGTARLMDILVNEEHSVKKVMVAASMSSYGEGTYECAECGLVYPPLRGADQMESGGWSLKCPGCGKDVKPVPTPESKTCQPNSIYAISKKDQEDIVLNIGKTYGLPVVSLRYFNVYGPRQSLSNPYTGVAAIFISRVKNNNPPVIYEDGLQTRDFISVYDIAEANMLAMEKKAADYEVFNVGSGEPTSIKGVAETIISLFKSEVEPDVTNKFRKGDVRHCYADTKKIEKKLGFKPKTSFADGTADLIKWSEGVESEDKFETAKTELEQRGLV